jgi:Alcohol dehydrogenase GroES-like domain
VLSGLARGGRWRSFGLASEAAIEAAQLQSARSAAISVNPTSPGATLRQPAACDSSATGRERTQETTTIRAAVNTRYGPPDVVHVRQVPRPEPQASEVLVRVHASTVSRTDCGMRRPHPWFVRLAAGLLRPKRTILGMDFAGEVEAVGAGVTAFKPGDRVFGLSPDVYGAHAEYLSLPEHGAFA